MSENLQQVIFYTCLLAVIYMVWGTTGVTEALITLGAVLVFCLIWKIVHRWWFGPDDLLARNRRGSPDD